MKKATPSPSGGAHRIERATLDPKEISELKTKLQAILFSIQEGIAMTDFSGRILLVNDQARRMLGVRKGFPYEKKLLDYIEDAGLRRSIGTMLDSSDRITSLELNVSGREGDPTDLKVTKTLVTNAQGEILGRVLVLRDTTSEKQLERMKDDFLHAITHDLKSPLTSIQGYLDLFLDGDLGPLQEDQRFHMRTMDISTKRLLKLISNILDLAKIEAGQMAIDKESIDVIRSMDQAVHSVQGVAQQNKVQVLERALLLDGGGARTVAVYPELKDAPGQVPAVRLDADATLIERAVTNLLDNALKFTPPGGRVEASAEEAPDRVWIRVKDTGPGIPEKYLGTLFHKFSQVPGTHGGTGLGLMITKKIVEAHGGQITVRSKIGEGTEFEFWLPK